MFSDSPSDRQLGYVTLLFHETYTSWKEYENMPLYKKNGAVLREAIFLEFCESLGGFEVSNLIDSLIKEKEQAFIGQIRHLGWDEFAEDYMKTYVPGKKRGMRAS